MGNRILWEERGFSKTFYSRSTNTIMFDSESLVFELSEVIERENTGAELIVLHDTVFRIVFTDDNTQIDAWVDLRARDNGSSYYYLSGISAAAPSITNEITRKTAQQIYKRAQQILKRHYKHSAHQQYGRVMITAHIYFNLPAYSMP